MSIIELLFDPNNENIDFFIQLNYGHTWEELFDLFCSLFTECCQRVGKKVSFDDILLVKSKFKQCHVV